MSAETLGHPSELISLVGEIDLATALVAIRIPACRPGTVVTVDMSGATLCDASCLGHLVRLRTRCRRAGAYVTIVGVPRRIAKVFHLTGRLAVMWA